MTRQEFAEVCSYITAGIGKTLSADSMNVYFDLLGDLEFETFKTAAKRAILEHPWSTFPSIAELRTASIETMRGEVSGISSGEAWEMAWSAIGRIDPEVGGSIQRGCEELPKLVVRAMNSMGIVALCYGNEPVSVLRGQFMRIYEDLEDRDKQEALMPERLRHAIENGERKTIQEFIGNVADAIGFK